MDHLDLLFRWAIIAGVLLVALIGLLFITRGTAVRHVVGVGGDGTPVAPAEPQFPLAVAMLTGTVLTPGNRVELALNGDGTYPRLRDDLRAARKFILLQTYYGKPGQLADGLNALLLERAAARVRIFILYDAFGNKNIPQHHLDELRAAGIAVVPFRPLRLSTLYTLQNRSHVRAVVIDGAVGWTGGFGIDDKWLGDGRSNAAWRDTNVRFEGPAVRQIEAAFAAAWTEATGVLFSGRATIDWTGSAECQRGCSMRRPRLAARWQSGASRSPSPATGSGRGVRVSPKRQSVALRDSFESAARPTGSGN